MTDRWLPCPGNPPKRPHGLAWVLAFLLFILTPPPATGQEGSGDEAGSPLQIEDMFKIKRAGGPAVSPDGQWVAYTVSTSSLEPGKSGTRIWMVPVHLYS